MFIRPFSDLHSEFSDFDMVELPTDKDDILILAGDIGVANNLMTFHNVKKWAPRFRHVIQICGNHEYYHGSMIRVPTKIRENMAVAGITNWNLAQDDVVRIDNVSFVCGTLWTDFNKSNPLVMGRVQSGLNDYNYIRTGSIATPYMRKINAHDILKEHITTRKYIFNAIAQEKAAGQTVVVISHHAPCELSIDTARYGNDPINFGYASDLSTEILDTEPKLWIHGHTHTSFDYMVGNTRVKTNPRGYAYPQSPPENRAFDPVLRIEV